MCGGGWRKWDERRGAASTGIRSCSPTNARGERLAVALRGKVLEVSIGGNMERNAVNCSFCRW